jgi:hypothetical protein
MQWRFAETDEHSRAFARPDSRGRRSLREARPDSRGRLSLREALRERNRAGRVIVPRRVRLDGRGRRFYARHERSES